MLEHERNDFVSILGIICALICLSACGTLPRLPAVPENETTHAAVLHSLQFRYWPALKVDALYENAELATEREESDLRKSGHWAARLPPANYLAISGGGDDGAFGAGVMVGWTKHGDRPTFKVVTGVSAGALIAPFAYLGSEYDYVLKDVAVSIQRKDVFNPRTLVNALLSDAFADDRPLEGLITKYVTRSLLDAVAQEYAKGRVLLIGTTDLDSGQAVIWNMGAIAEDSDPAALRLFRQVMLASASIPGVFPPVMIDVEVAQEHHQEMHVDGGVVAEVFLFPPSFVEDITAGLAEREREHNVYIIRNGRIGAQWQMVPRRTITVGKRAIAGLIDAQGQDDLFGLQLIAREEHEHFHVAYIDADFKCPRRGSFDSQYLHRLYDYAATATATGNLWHTALPQVIRSTGPSHANRQ